MQTRNTSWSTIKELLQMPLLVASTCGHMNGGQTCVIENQPDVCLQSNGCSKQRGGEWSLHSSHIVVSLVVQHVLKCFTHIWFVCWNDQNLYNTNLCYSSVFFREGVTCLFQRLIEWLCALTHVINDVFPLSYITTNGQQLQHLNNTYKYPMLLLHKN